METAAQRSVTLSDEVGVRREGPHTYVDTSYTEAINVLPWYAYPYTFQVHVDTIMLQGSLK